MKRFLPIIGLIVALTGCSVVGEAIKPILTNDLVRTSELAEKYGKPDVKQCADFLNAALNAEDSRSSQLDALLKEPTDGILSSALKAAILADLVRSFNDPAMQAKLRADFDANCSKVAGQIMLDLARQARKGFTRQF